MMMTPDQAISIGQHAAHSYVSEPHVTFISHVCPWPHDRAVARLTFRDGGERFISADRYGNLTDHDRASDKSMGYVSDTDALDWIERQELATI